MLSALTRRGPPDEDDDRHVRPTRTFVGLDLLEARLEQDDRTCEGWRQAQDKFFAPPSMHSLPADLCRGKSPQGTARYC
jgi:hypothetical protein